MTGVRRTCEDTHTDTQREERCVTVETEIEVMQLQGKECQGLAASTGRQEEARRTVNLGFFPRAVRGSMALPTP